MFTYTKLKELEKRYVGWPPPRKKPRKESEAPTMSEVPKEISDTELLLHARIDMFTMVMAYKHLLVAAESSEHSLKHAMPIDENEEGGMRC